MADVGLQQHIDRYCPLKDAPLCPEACAEEDCKCSVRPSEPRRDEDSVQVEDTPSQSEEALRVSPVLFTSVWGDKPYPVMEFQSGSKCDTTPKRHLNSKRFHELLEEAGELHDLKQSDYGKGADPFANVRSSEEWGIHPWVGAMVRLNDKVRRLQSLAVKGELYNESAIDSFMDIAVYALIARVLYEQGAEQDTQAEEGQYR